MFWSAYLILNCLSDIELFRNDIPKSFDGVPDHTMAPDRNLSGLDPCPDQHQLGRKEKINYDKTFSGIWCIQV